LKAAIKTRQDLAAGQIPGSAENHQIKMVNGYDTRGHGDILPELLRLC